MENMQKTRLFEETPVPKAVMALAIPTVISSLVMVIYNLADTYFVGMFNSPLPVLCRKFQHDEQGTWQKGL